MSARIIAIDGPAASGKSTVARRVALATGDLYVDSGAVYRGIAWAALERGVDVHEPTALETMLVSLTLVFTVDAGAVRYTIDGVAPGAALRTEAVNRAVSPVAVVPTVRQQIVSWLRDMVALGNLVVEGRDIGTAVFPATPFKFYLDASPEERARRRHRDMADVAPDMNVAAVDESLRRRDRIDSSRAADPLRIAEDACVIDSTGLSIDDVVARVLGVVNAVRDE